MPQQVVESQEGGTRTPHAGFRSQDFLSENPQPRFLSQESLVKTPHPRSLCEGSSAKTLCEDCSAKISPPRFLSHDFSIQRFLEMGFQNCLGSCAGVMLSTWHLAGASCITRFIPLEYSCVRFHNLAQKEASRKTPKHPPLRYLNKPPRSNRVVKVCQ